MSDEDKVQRMIAPNIKVLADLIKNDIEELSITHPKLRDKKHGVFIIGILFEDGHMHTIHPEATLAYAMLKRMGEEIAGKISNTDSEK